MIFLESFWPVLLIGIAVEAVLMVALLRTGRGNLLWAMIGVALFTIAGVVVERLVVTQREAVENTLDAAVDAVLASDLNRLLDCVSPTAKKTRDDARQVFGRVEVGSTYIHSMEIKIDDRTSPYTAKARFQVIGQARDRKGEIPYEGFNRAVTVELRLEGNRWLVYDYSIEGLTAPFDFR
jgi:hypothetical protein